MAQAHQLDQVIALLKPRAPRLLCQTSAPLSPLRKEKGRSVIGPAFFQPARSESATQRTRMVLPIAAPRATRPAAAASATTGETWIDFFHHGSAICGASAGRAAMICAFTCAGVTKCR